MLMCLGISLRTSSQSKILAQNGQTFHCHFGILEEVEQRNFKLPLFNFHFNLD